jgi:hypothetical protein
MNGFPPKVLVDPSATISAAGLAGVSLTQKMRTGVGKLKL